MESSATESPSRDPSVKRSHHDDDEDDEVETQKRFSNPKVHIDNECSLLRETVSNQQKSIQNLYEELDKERNASSTAADEALSMIRRLQDDKAEIEMELRQYKVYAGEKMEHDLQEISALGDLVYQKEQTILALTCETQAYKHRMMSYGLTEEEADGDKKIDIDIDSVYDYDLLAYDKPPRCSVNEEHGHDNYVADDDDDDDNYPPADSPRGREHLKTLDLRIREMETSPGFTQLNGDYYSGETGRDVSEKLVIGQSPRRQGHFRRSSIGSSSSHLCASKEVRHDVSVDYSRSESYGSKKVEHVYDGKDDSSEIGDDMSDRVYTIDSVHHSGVTEQKHEAMTTNSNAGFPRERMSLGDPDIAKLYTRLRALEVDRESMKEALLSVSTEKAQMVLLKEIAQHLSKEVVPQRRLPLRKASIAGLFTFRPVVKVISLS
ncbi:unnamed protein product [Cochlearia groenlandica]